ncbi:MAG: signal peptidase I [Parcubacteria group bacterium RIFCSPHIGHO2_01_FULL_45_26]|nr:MAG: signal peptidase I [Parcubacteria group bacterium RIFCSPHIGHO2_01_FULL_45_26]
MKRFWLAARETLEIVIVALITVFIIRNFLIQPFLVNGASMEPNFNDGDYLLIDEITYRFRQPQRGEVVVFRYPNDRSVFFIKRIIGLPGETVAIRDNAAYINNVELKEDYLPPIKTSGRTELALGPDEYFVLGDNRSFSFDSRNWGSAKFDDIIGIARVRIFPFTQFEVFKHGQ